MAIVETVWNGAISKLSSGAGTKSAGVYVGSQSDLGIPGYGTARGTNPKSSGRWYFEILVTGAPLDVGIGRNHLESMAYIAGATQILRDSNTVAGPIRNGAAVTVNAQVRVGADGGSGVIVTKATGVKN